MGDYVTTTTLRAFHDGGLCDAQDFGDEQGVNFYVDGDKELGVEALCPDLDAQAHASALELHRRINSVQKQHVGISLT
ncbi:hypothetical protein [Pseudomonas poae]|uniref:Uncharacterized protein n=1 Tax=Pseudomonas poae TaxID=200451 RepID=A0ABY0RBS9_9PSED|nr:hypothetical protein [Pseudomonas poae]SDN55550.1 hypothetical protein SAMN04490208_0683 [Pseudomonas poae]